MPTLEFWYEYASTYSYLSVMRIEEAARVARVALRWRPFLLGPIFNAQGWDTSPFNLFPEKGAYMWRDMDRLCQARGLPFRPPSPFPQNGLYAARLTLLGAEEGWAPRFSRAVFTAQFAHGLQLANKQALGNSLEALGLDSKALLARIDEPDVKSALKAQTEQAQGLGIFGAPSFVTEDGELFWGDDRLEQALLWAKGEG
ncbi:MAG: 2-hydroxychromene-2-carboxylate isomerase [Hyphomicrobiales bacterium]|nr:2-hydroxychromene-2-carboxylate isomerase [Hyphomicrobiales bacterium]